MTTTTAVTMHGVLLMSFAEVATFGPIAMVSRAYTLTPPCLHSNSLLPLTSCVTLIGSLNVFMLQFPHLSLRMK